MIHRIYGVSTFHFQNSNFVHFYLRMFSATRGALKSVSQYNTHLDWSSHRVFRTFEIRLS